MGFDLAREVRPLHATSPRANPQVLIIAPGDSPEFQVFWSEDVISEVLHNLRKKHPTWNGAKITRIRAQLTGTFETGRVEDFVVDGSYTGGDEGDAHVHAAATACGADFLMTLNTKDFASDRSTTYEVVTPDDFFVLVDDVAPQLVGEVTAQQCDYWFRRAEDFNLAEQLRRAGCPDFAGRVRDHMQHVDLGATPT